jgi:hypothetical protein
MSRLYFTPVNQAFTLGSSQIKDTQEEIAHLTKLILESNSPNAKKKKIVPETMSTEYNYERIGPPDKQTAIFRPNKQQDDFDYNLLKVVGHPRFDDIVKNYALINHPEWLLKETVYVPGNQSTSTFGGNKYQSTICLEVQRYMTFFIISVLIFILITIFI